MTSGIVLDASAAVAWASPDEFPPQVLTEAIESGPTVAPALWIYEVHNVLQILRRRHRWNEQDWLAANSALAAVSIELEPPLRARIENEVTLTAEKYGLTIYDAAYLELAQRRRLPLATLDKALREAARRAKVKVI